MKLIAKQFVLKKASGFTLMELMIVIAIIGIMSAITLPMLMNPENKTRKAARELMGDMQRTRGSAVSTNQDWAIVFDPANNLYYICSDRGVDNVWSTVTGSNTIEKTVSLTASAPGVRYGSGVATATISGGAFGNGVSYNSDVLTFNSRGTCSAGYVYLFYSDSSYAIGTLSTGIVRIRRWAAGAWQ